MRKLFKWLGAIAAVAFCAPSIAAADATYDDGAPMMYVRGTFNSWGVQSQYLMTRDGDNYSITLDALDGQFKLGGSDWVCNLGGETSDVHVSEPSHVVGVQNGPNFYADNLQNVTISVKLNRNGATASNSIITFAVNGVAPDPYKEPIVDPTSGTLPVLYINVYCVDDAGEFILDAAGNKILNDELIDYNLAHKNYFVGEYWLDVTPCEWMVADGLKSVGSKEEPLPLEIKARGNYTRIGFSKKPFKLKLGKKQDLLGLTPAKSKHYAILALADDVYGYMRNYVGFNLGKRMGLPWTPSQQPIEVVINGDYRGFYALTESIRVGDGRVPITELADEETLGDLISGGYLVELDNYDEENQIQLNEKACVGGHYLDKLRVTFDTPEVYSEIQTRFVSQQFSTMNDFVGANSDELWSYLDLDDAARYYLVREMISDVESFHGSTYLFRDRGEGQKWHFSPIWDCGNAFNGPTDGFFYNHDPYGNTWIPSLRCNDAFNQKVAETWKWFCSQCLDGFEDELSAYAAHITAAAKVDHERWGSAPTPSAGGSSVANNSDMQSRLNAVLAHLNAKRAWLATQFGTPTGNEQEPVRDTTPAAPLPDYAQSGVENVVIGNDASAPVEYYDLTGRRVANPASGTIYIVRQGVRTTKQLYR